MVNELDKEKDEKKPAEKQTKAKKVTEKPVTVAAKAAPRKVAAKKTVKEVPAKAALKTTDEKISRKRIVNSKDNLDGTKEKLIVNQYKSFSNYERNRESSILQFILVFAGIISGFGVIIYNSLELNPIELNYMLTIFSIISLIILVWIGEYILISSYHNRVGQAVRAKMRKDYNIENIVPSHWDDITGKQIGILTLYYRAHFYITTIMILAAGLFPEIYVNVVLNKMFYSIHLDLLKIPIIFMIICFFFLLIYKRYFYQISLIRSLNDLKYSFKENDLKFLCEKVNKHHFWVIRKIIEIEDNEHKKELHLLWRWFFRMFKMY